MQRRGQERDIAGSVRHAGGGEGDEDGFASGGGWRERVGSAERPLLAAVVQTVISGPVGGTPMPEMMMSAVRPLRIKVPLQSLALKTSLLEIVRWVLMVD